MSTLVDVVIRRVAFLSDVGVDVLDGSDVGRRRGVVTGLCKVKRTSRSKLSGGSPERIRAAGGRVLILLDGLEVVRLNKETGLENVYWQCGE